MRDAIDELGREQRTLAALAGLIELEAEVFEAGERPDYETVQDILRYLLTYPVQVHHPVADAIFARLLGKMPDLADDIRDLGREHVHLTATTRRFDAAMEEVLYDERLPQDWFADTARGFAAAYRRHLRQEGLLLPAARRLLGDADWAVIARTLPRPHDPMATPAPGAPPADPDLLMLRARVRDGLIEA